jgi:phosphatidylglycerol lysyltransferase
VLADPVGPEDEIEDVIAEFSEFCEDNDWGIGFHQTLPDFLPIYKKLGFRKLKMGDEAVVDLTKFSMQGRAMGEFRNVTSRLEKAGIHVLEHEPPVPDEIIRQARQVSDEWLKIPGRRERGFTLGSFSTSYIRSTPVVTVVDRDRKILGFVNLIPSSHPGEATIDLMRRRTDAPNGAIDYLFIKLFSLCRDRGFKRFSLGIAPMSGFQEKEDATREERAVHFFFQRLNFLFSYRGLRQFKAKFGVEWEPRYSVYRNVLDLPRLAIALTRVTEV